jgi:RecA-family ATPase
MYYICSLPNPGEPGSPKELFTDDAALVERFVKAEDRPGRGVYECINPLVPGARRRNLETVAELRFIYFDLDLQNIDASRDEVIARLRQLPVSFVWVRDSGSGNLHVGIEIKDPPPRETPEYNRVVAVWKSLAEKLAADPAPVHPAALIRRVGTHNTKNGKSGECRQLWNGGGPLDFTELEELDELLAEPLLTRKTKATNGHDRAADDAGDAERGPVDLEAELAAMTDGKSVNAVHIRIIPSLLRKGEHPADVLERVVDETMQRVGKRLAWTREIEVRAVISRILAGYNNVLLKTYHHTTGAIPAWLPGEFHERWIASLAGGHRPSFRYNRHGFHLRANGPKGEAGADRNREQKASQGADTGEKTTAAGAAQTGKTEKRIFHLRPLQPFDPATLPPRQWLYGRHYQRRTVSATIAPGGVGKSSLDLVEAIAMATCRNLLGEQPEERLRVWYHNGEDNFNEILRRVAAVCQHYKLPQEEWQGWLYVTSGTEFPLRVAQGYSNLVIDEALVRRISTEVADNEIDVAILDPLVTLHRVSEQDNGKMDTIVRIFFGIADAHDCAFELAHHTRKLPPGSNADYTMDDGRGASAVADAVRAARVLNRMSSKDADDASIGEVDRLSRFRIDRAKGNYSAPASTATWRQFVNVELPNGDEVGVIAPWDFTGQGAETPERATAERKAEDVFLRLLDKFTARGINVSANSGPTYAPARFAAEREAKTAKVSKAALKAAMDRLLDSWRVQSETHGRDRHRLVLAQEQPEGETRA